MQRSRYAGIIPAHQSSHRSEYVPHRHALYEPGMLHSDSLTVNRSCLLPSGIFARNLHIRQLSRPDDHHLHAPQPRFLSVRFNRLATPQSNKVPRILGPSFAASAQHHNIETFLDAGLIPVERNGDFYLSVQPENARRVRGHPPGAGEIPPAPLPPEASGADPSAERT
jgi:hypothetical protein